MPFQQKPLNRQVIVITGATSGIGLATAIMAAKAGASLVLAARSADGLQQAEARLAIGRRCISVVADVVERSDVGRIASAAIGQFGGFDTWVNNAGQTIYGRLEDVDEEDSRALMDVNFWGTVNGSLVAVAHLKRRGGTLINVGSIGSDFAFPLQGMYSASKHAIRGFTDALRMELKHEGAPVNVTLIKPASIDTPLPQRARNYMDREPDLPPPVYRPREVADFDLGRGDGVASRHLCGRRRQGDQRLRRPGTGALRSLAAPPFIMALQKRKEPPRRPEGAFARRHGRRRGTRDTSGFRQPVQRFHARAQSSENLRGSGGRGGVGVERGLEEAGPLIEPQRAFVETPHGRLAYCRAGAGKPVVLIHGSLVTADDMVIALMACLARHYDVVAFDRPGPWRQRADPPTMKDRPTRRPR